KNLRIDAVRPVVNSINRLLPTAQTTNVQEVVWRVIFTENTPAGGPFGVTGVDVDDFTLTVTAGSITGAEVIDVTQSLSPLIYDVTVATGTGSGTLRMDVPATATIEDLAGTPYAANFA